MTTPTPATPETTEPPDTPGPVPFRLGRVAPGIAVTDISRSIAFYTATFGLEVTFTNGDPVGFAILERDDAELHLTRLDTHVATTANVAHLMVSDATQCYARCQEQGVRIVKRLRDADYGLRTFVLADPDGNRIDVGETL